MHLRSSLAPLVLAGLLLFALRGAQSQNSAPPALRANSTLVVVDVVVTDRDKSVSGLDRGRFHVFEDGNEQTIFSFDEHQPAAPPPASPAPPALPPNTYSNLPAYPPSSAVNVLLLDALNTPLSDQIRVRQTMINYLGTLKSGTTMAIFTLSSELRMVTEFTTDPAALVAALRKPKAVPRQSPMLDSEQSSDLADIANAQQNAQLTAGAASAPGPGNFAPATAGPMGAVQALQQFQADQTSFQNDVRMKITLGAMQQLADYLIGIPGRKNVIWFSGAFPLVALPDSSLFHSFANVSTYRDGIQRTTDMLAAARIAIYPVAAGGIAVQSSFNASNASPLSDQALGTQFANEGEQRSSEQATMLEVADETGGEAYLGTNELDKAVAGAAENGSTYYTLAYVPKNAALDGRYRRIEVRVDGDHDFKLAYRRGYYADATGKFSPSEASQNAVFAAALAHDSPPATAILFKARVLPASDPAFQGISLPGKIVGEQSASFKGPARPYIIDLTVDAHGLVLDSLSDGSRKAAIELAIVVYNGDGEQLSYYAHAFQIGLKAEILERIMASGIPLRLPFDLPVGQVDLRVGVHDLNADRAGSLEIPLDVPASDKP